MRFTPWHRISTWTATNFTALEAVVLLCLGLRRCAKRDSGTTMRKIYKPPTLIQYGHIADHTFTTPSGHIKGSVGTMHVDNFGETVGHSSDNSGLASS